MNDANQQPGVTEACSHVSSCNLFPVLDATSSLAYWTNTYCRGNFRRCARHIRMADGLVVTPNLLPNGKKL